MHPRPPTPRRAFTIIEVVLAIALIGLLMTGIFSVQKGAMDVSREVLTREAKTLRVHAFCELLRKTYEQMPGNSKVSLQFIGGIKSDLMEVAFTDYPLAFSWPGVVAGSKTVLFRTERSPAGGLQATILYLEDEQAQAYLENRLDESKAVGRLTILDTIDTLTWSFYNEQTDAWEYEWPITNNRRPTFVKLDLRFVDQRDPISVMFWIPTMVNPQQFTTGQNQSGSNGNPNAPGGTPQIRTP